MIKNCLKIFEVSILLLLLSGCATTQIKPITACQAYYACSAYNLKLHRVFTGKALNPKQSRQQAYVLCKQASFLSDCRDTFPACRYVPARQKVCLGKRSA